MDEKRNTPEEYWGEDTYRTGKTRPPRRRGGLIALLLIAVIFLSGIASSLGLLNIRLFRQMQDEKVPEETSSLSFAAIEPDFVVPEETIPFRQEDSLSLEIAQSPASVENVPQEGGLSLQQIYTQAIDSVVSISCSLPGSGASSGTGVVLSEDGYIVTNSHVVEDAEGILVHFTDGRELMAQLVGADEVSDLAVLLVDAQDLTAAQFGDSSVIRVGDLVVAIGDPLGIELRGTMTDGIISAINRDITTGGRTMTLLQTNAALNSGNSGGPLLNCYGQVIGINTMKIGDYMSANGVEGLGFAIPSTTVKEIVDQLIAQGYVSGRPDLGFVGQDISVLYQRLYNLPQGVYISQVDTASDAYAQGIRPGDVLVVFEETRIYNTEDLQQMLYSFYAGDVVQVGIYRGGTTYQLELTISQAGKASD